MLPAFGGVKQFPSRNALFSRGFHDARNPRKRPQKHDFRRPQTAVRRGCGGDRPGRLARRLDHSKICRKQHSTPGDWPRRSRWSSATPGWRGSDRFPGTGNPGLAPCAASRARLGVRALAGNARRCFVPPGGRGNRVAGVFFALATRASTSRSPRRVSDFRQSSQRELRRQKFLRRARNFSESL